STLCMYSTHTLSFFLMFRRPPRSTLFPTRRSSDLDSTGAGGTRFIFTAVDGPPCADINQTGCVRIDVQNTITHEAGHTIGLDHRSEEHTSELQSLAYLVCRLLLEKKKKKKKKITTT